MRYQKKPLQIDAFQFGVDSTQPAWLKEAFDSGICTYLIHEDVVKIKTIDKSGTVTGEVACTFGNYIVRGIKGEIYPCQADIFEELHEPVVQDPSIR